jgi:hypothetical protein
MTEQDSEVEQLESRIEQLEELVARMMPSRRDALKLGGAAVLGGAAMSSSTSAGTQQAGTIGTAGSPVDVEAEDISASDTITTQDLTVNGSATGIDTFADGDNYDGLGTGDFTNLNSLEVDNTTTTQDIAGLDSINGDALVTSGTGDDLEVQKDGSDATGVINFKTS